MPKDDFSSAPLRLANIPLGSKRTALRRPCSRSQWYPTARHCCSSNWNLAPMAQSVEVVDHPELIGSDSPTPVTLINRQEIEQTPGADRTNSMTMITDYVPGAYMIHDQLHVRGGHQVTWLLDGVPIPNTNIASNVGPQFDPKDIDYLEVQRGSYSAEYGDRTYGVFNVTPRTGFESNNEAELVVSYGNFNQTDNQLKFASHTHASPTTPV